MFFSEAIQGLTKDFLWISFKNKSKSRILLENIWGTGQDCSWTLKIYFPLRFFFFFDLQWVFINNYFKDQILSFIFENICFKGLGLNFWKNINDHSRRERGALQVYFKEIIKYLLQIAFEWSIIYFQYFFFFFC